MKHYRSYMDRITAPAGLRQRVLEAAEQGARPRRPARRLTLRLAALSACCVLAVAGGRLLWLGGSAPITVAAVIFTGILGAMLVPAFLKLFRVKDPVAAGLAIGACSHAIGTSKALEIGEAEGAMSSIAIGACGLITVLFSMFLR